MSDCPFENEDRQFTVETEQVQPDVHNKKPGCDAVCIDTARIYDSCGAKDCLRNLQVYFTTANQAIVETACAVRVRNVNLITATVDVEFLPFNKGFFAVDTTFYFGVNVDLTTTTGLQNVLGYATYSKRVIMYGGEGCVRSFSSDQEEIVCTAQDDYSFCAPRANLQVSNPISLSARLINCPDSGCPGACGAAPDCVTSYIGGAPGEPTTKFVTTTIGLFTITQLVRNVQLLIPAYDYCLPRRECPPKPSDPCEAFSKVDFPTDSFFPTSTDKKPEFDLNELDFGGFGCSQCKE